MSSLNACDACTRRNKTSVASQFCTDCGDKLCPECVSVHSTFRAFISHHLVTIELAENKSFYENKHCTIHNDLVLEFYCSIHDNLCCKSCIGSVHRSCENIIPIEVASKGIKFSSLYEETAGEVLHMMTLVSSLFEERDKSRTDLDESKMKAIQKADKVKAELHRRIDDLFSKSVRDINALYLQLLENGIAAEKEIDEQTQTIRDYSSKMEFMSKNGSKCQIFRLLNFVKSDIVPIQGNLERFIKSLTVSTIAFKEPDVLPLAESVGTVVKKQRPCAVQFKPFKSKQAQTVYQIKDGIHLERKVTIPRRGSISITGICFTQDNRIIMCNNSPNDKELLVLTDYGQQLETIKLPYRPYGIALDPSSDEALVTMPEGSLIQVIDNSSLLPVRPIHPPEPCYGIAFIKNNIAVGGYGKIYIINKKGISLMSFPVGRERLISIFLKNNRLFCCDGSSYKIFSVDIKGGNILTYTSPSIGKPVGVALDNKENIYGVCFNTNTLHQFSKDGKNDDVLLKKRDGIKAPCSITFNSDSTKLYIPNDSDKCILIFSCNFKKIINVIYLLRNNPNKKINYGISLIDEAKARSHPNWNLSLKDDPRHVEIFYMFQAT